MSTTRFSAVVCALAIAAASVPAAQAQIVTTQQIQIGPGGDGGPLQMLPPGRQAKTGTGSQRGRVLAIDTGNAVRRAQVRISGPDIGTKTALTDAQGRFEFRTIRPGSYPEGGVPAHIHLIFTTTCCGRQASEMVFEDDPLITKAFRDGHGPSSVFVFARPAAKPDGSQEVTYTITLKPAANFPAP